MFSFLKNKRFWLVILLKFSIYVLPIPSNHSLHLAFYFFFPYSQYSVGIPQPNKTIKPQVDYSFTSTVYYLVRHGLLFLFFFFDRLLLFYLFFFDRLLQFYLLFEFLLWVIIFLIFRHSKSLIDIFLADFHGFILLFQLSDLFLDALFLWLRFHVF